MKKFFVVAVVFLCLFFVPRAALGLTTAEVQAYGGETTLMFVGDRGLQLGTEYGITSQIGLIVGIRQDTTKIGAKYEFDSNLSLLLGAVNNAPFLGANIDARR